MVTSWVERRSVIQPRNLAAFWSALSGPTVSVNALSLLLSLTSQTITNGGGEVPAGHRTRRTVYIVRIDGQEFQCFSLEQVQELLDRAKAIATTVSQQIIAKPQSPKPPLPKIRTAQPEIQPLVQKAQQEIRTVYRDAFVTAEIRILFELAQREEDDTLFWLM